jgi:hypothetical protein
MGVLQTAPAAAQGVRWLVHAGDLLVGLVFCVLLILQLGNS